MCLSHYLCFLVNKFGKCENKLMKSALVDYYRAAWNADTRSSDEKAVRPSDRVSVKRMNCDKTEERSVRIFIPYERSFSLVF